MKVLFINSVCGIGSTGKIVLDLYNILSDRGHDCCVAYGRGESPDKINTFRIGNKLNVLEHVFETRIFDNHGFASRISTYKFINFIRDYKPDIIHLHNLHGYYLNVKMLFDFLKKSRIKVIWTMHDCWAISPNSAFIDFDEQGHLPTGKKEENQKMDEYPSTLLYRRSQKNYKRKKEVFSGLDGMVIITPSDWLKYILKKSFFKGNPILTIYNGINLELINKVKNDNLEVRLNSNKNIILAVANIWDDRKGLRFINELAEKINDDCLIYVVGKIEENFINQKIAHVPQTTNFGELVNLYQQARVFINPTLADNFPTTNIEALACGTPVIAFDTGGNREVITSEVGEITKERTSDSLLESLDQVLSKPKSFYRDNCLEKADKFSKENMCANYLDVMSERNSK